MVYGLGDATTATDQITFNTAEANPTLKMGTMSAPSGYALSNVRIVDGDEISVAMHNSECSDKTGQQCTKSERQCHCQLSQCGLPHQRIKIPRHRLQPIASCHRKHRVCSTAR